MPKKKGKKKVTNSDFTINDCANAPKPVRRVKKSITTEPLPEKSWDDLQEDDFDIIEETNADGTKTFVYKKKRNHSKSETDIKDRPGIVYPEIVWYLLSPYIKPEDVGNFAGITQATYSITKRESFWRALYKRFCQNSPKLPDKLRIENNYKLYGLRQRVIRALYHTYDVFIQKVQQQSSQDCRPHELVRRRCVSVWYCKGPTYWSVYFKLKKSKPERVKCNDFIEELGRIDANPEEDSQVLQGKLYGLDFGPYTNGPTQLKCTTFPEKMLHCRYVTCQSFYEVPPLMGMTLSSVSVVLSQGFRHHRLHLGFNTGHYNICRNITPEHSVVIDTVVNILVYDWWHPKYPHFENKLPSSMRDEESLPVLKKDFFTLCKC